MTSTVVHQGRPRVGLLGNPSDLYRGRVIGFTFDDFAARAELSPGEAARIVGPGGDELVLGEHLDPHAGRGGTQLAAAALAELAAFAPQAVDWRRRPFELRLASDIPRQVGLSGSSAIVVASLRAFAEHFGVELSNFDCSELALRAETVQLGAVAGPQDRVLQSYGGLLYMDFSEPRRDDRYQRIAAGEFDLPGLMIAYNPVPGEDSGRVHSEVRARWEAGDAQVRAGVARFSEIAAQGLDDLRRGDLEGFCDAIDANLAARCALWDVAPTDLEVASLARGAGAAAKLCGSGGALVLLPRPGRSGNAVRAALEPTGWKVFEPAMVV